MLLVRNKESRGSKALAHRRSPHCRAAPGVHTNKTQLSSPAAGAARRPCGPLKFATLLRSKTMWHKHAYPRQPCLTSSWRSAASLRARASGFSDHPLVRESESEPPLPPPLQAAARKASHNSMAWGGWEVGRIGCRLHNCCHLGWASLPGKRSCSARHAAGQQMQH